MKLFGFKKKTPLPKVRKYDNAWAKITRAGLSSNPVERFSYTGNGTVFSNNQLVTLGGNSNPFFVGGDTATYEYDMSLKVAGSVAECPIRGYYRHSTSIGVPTDTWTEYALQSDIDKIKLQDSTALMDGTSTNALYSQIMLELDLTPLCNTYFGGSNSALNAALKSFSVDVWAMGSGSNAGVNTNGVNCYIYNATTSSWASPFGSNTGSAIGKVNYTQPSPTNRLNSSNKVYFLIASQYASDGTIASSVSLDYINIKVDIARTPDTVSPITVNLPKYWAMVGSFSTCWDNTETISHMFMHVKKDTSNDYQLFYNASIKKITVGKTVNGTWTEASTSSQTFSKYQTYKYIFGQSPSGMFLRILKNNSTIEKIDSANSTFWNGMANIYSLSRDNNTQQSNAFAESFNLVDLTRIGKIRFGSELVTNGDFSNGGTGWTVDSGTWTWDGNATQTSTGYAHQKINVISNTKYILSGDVSASVGKIDLAYYDATNTRLSVESQVITPTIKSIVFITPPTCTYIQVYLDYNTSGVIVYDNISLKQVLQDGFTDAEALSLLKGQMHIKENNLVVNGDFSQGTTGWKHYGTYSTETVTNGVMRSTKNTNKPYFGNDSNWNIPIGHKVYVSALINGNKANQFRFGVFNAFGTSGTSGSMINLTTSMQYYSSVITLTDVGNGINIDGYYYTTDGDYIEVDNVLAIDLTTLFGAGNEPTQAQMDALFSQSSTNPIGLLNLELFDVNKVVLHTNAMLNNGVITLNATAAGQASYLIIPVLPNNQYSINSNVVGSTPGFSIQEYYNGILLKETYNMSGQGKTIITTSRTNNIRVQLYAGAAGTFTFSNISLKRRD